MDDNKATFKEYLSKVNTFIEAEAAKKDEERTYIRIFRPYNTNKLNIIGSFEDAINAEENKCDHFTTESKKSFGMIATEQFSDYCFLNSTKRYIYDNEDSFRDYVNENYKNFVIDDDELKNVKAKIKELLENKDTDKDILKKILPEDDNEDTKEIFQKALYARALLSVFYECSITISGKVHYLARIEEILKEDNGIIVFLNEEKKLAIRGVPSSCSFGKINDKYRFKIKNRELYTNIKDTSEVSSENNNYHELDYYYSSKKENNDIYISKAGALYSGVIPRLFKVEHKKPTLDNSSLESIKLSLGRTSYFTMYSMGNSVWEKHEFSNILVYKNKSYKDILKALDRYEVIIQNEYHKNMEKLGNTGIDEELEVLNNYLNYSLAQHNMNITGNLITKDGVCLYTVRNSNIQDAGSYYPSVNGGSEIYDSNVRFYDNSVEEDKPSIMYSKDNVRFSQELTREAIAELGTIDDSSLWNYYGLTIMGKKKTDEQSFRSSFHFNIIGEKNSMDRFENVIDYKRKATEDFESTNLYGYNLYISNNKIDFATQNFFNAIKIIFDYNNFFQYIFILAASFFIGFESIKNEGIIMLGINVFFFLVSSLMIVRLLHNSRKQGEIKKSIHLIIDDETILDVEKHCKKICKKMKIKDHKKMDNELRVLTLMRLSDYFINKDKNNY